MGRTNIELDDELVEQAMRLTGARTKREVVDIALRRLVKKGTLVQVAPPGLIAQACLDLDAELLSPDRDFEGIARHTPLRLWQP